MKLAEDDLESSYFQPIRRGNDKIISHLFVIFIVVAFFSLFLFGFNRAQRSSEQSPSTQSRFVQEGQSEIGNFNDPASK